MQTIPLVEFLNMGGGEIMLIVIAILLLFGGKKLPELARGLGKGIREFKDASDGVKREIQRNINLAGIDEDDPQTTAQRTSREPEQDGYNIHQNNEETPAPSDTTVHATESAETDGKSKTTA
jgi:sec-independent protein translocase protein TatA